MRHGGELGRAYNAGGRPRSCWPRRRVGARDRPDEGPRGTGRRRAGRPPLARAVGTRRGSGPDAPELVGRPATVHRATPGETRRPCTLETLRTRPRGAVHVRTPAWSPSTSTSGSASTASGTARSHTSASTPATAPWTSGVAPTWAGHALRERRPGAQTGAGACARRQPAARSSRYGCGAERETAHGERRRRVALDLGNLQGARAGGPAPRSRAGRPGVRRARKSAAHGHRLERRRRPRRGPAAPSGPS